MARAKVEIREQSMDARVPSFPGTYGAIVIPALKGEVNTPRLVTNESDLLRYYTPDETIKVGYDSAYYSAIAYLIKSNKLWVTRAANNPLYGGCLLSQSKPFTSLNVYLNNGNNTLILRTSTDLEKTQVEQFYSVVQAAEKVSLVSDGTLPPELDSSSTYYVFNVMEDSGVYSFQIADTVSNAENGIPLEFSTNGIGNVTLNLLGSNSNKSLAKGVIDPSAYMMNSSDGKLPGLSSLFEPDITRDAFQVPIDVYNMAATGDRVQLTAATFPVADTGDSFAINTDYYVIKSIDQELQLARSASDAQSGVFIPISTTGENVVVDFQDKDASSALIVYTATNDFEVTSNFYSACETGDIIRFTSTVNDYPAPEIGDPITGDIDYYLIKTATANRVQIALTDANAQNGIAIGLASTGSSLFMTFLNKASNGNLTADISNDTISVDATFFDWIETRDCVRLSTTDALPGGLESDTDYFVIKGDSTIKLAASLEAVDIEESIDITNVGIGEHTILNVSNQELFGLEQYALFIYGANQGAWNNDLYITTVHYPYGDESTWNVDQRDAADTVKEEDCFKLYVYKKNPDKSFTLVEEHLCSRVKNKKDGYGKNVYVESVLEGSNYIRCIDNDQVDESIYPLNPASLLKLHGGDNGSQVTDTHMLQALDAYASTRNIFLTLLLDGGWATPAYQKQGLLTIAKNRKDCFAVLSTPYSAEVNSSYTTEIVKYRKETLNANDSHGAIYTCHLKIQDKFNDRMIFVPPDGYVAAAISETAANNEIWYPTAGTARGQLNVIDVAKRFTEGDMDYIYDNGVNPIDFYPGRGIRIWGNKTLSTRPNSLDRINVRMLLIVIEPAIAQFLDDFLFEFNDALTRSLVASGIESYMANIQARRGISGFRVVCSEENNTPEDIDSNRLNVWLFVAPLKSTEEIRFTTILTRTDAEFSLSPL